MDATQPTGAPVRRVWDVPTRVLHASLAVSVAIAAFTGDEPRWTLVHVGAGHAAAAAVALRGLWGFAGERWSRWTSFLGPGPGHTRAAGLSALAALTLVVGLTVTGFAVWGFEERAGPLAARLPVDVGLAVHEVHELLGWALGAWFVIHLAGIARASYVERQNLVRGMVDGRKVWAGAPVAARAMEGAAALLGVIGAATLVGAGRPTPEPLAAVDPEWASACGECHLAYPPELLPAASWRAMLATDAQHDHFGEDLFLADDELAALTAFAATRSADRRATESAARIADSVGAEAPLRITETPYWRSVHADVPASLFTSEAVGSEARCDACHGDAERGVFDGTAVRDPQPAKVAAGPNPEASRRSE